MQGYNLVLTLGVGSLLAFTLFFVFFKLFKWGGKMAALATAVLMLLIYIPLAVTHWEGLDVFAIHFAFFMMIPYGLGIIIGVQEERRQREGDKHVKTGMHWIPAFIIIFFMSIAVVDSIIISFATAGLKGGLAELLLPPRQSEDVGEKVNSQFTGTVPNDLQKEEKQYDAYVDKLNRQRERGWQITGGWDETPQQNQEAIFRLNVRDKAGAPITGASVFAEFRRAGNMRSDQRIDLQEATAVESQRGTYANKVNLPLPGCWKMWVKVTKGEAEHEIKGETEVATRVDGKLIIPECQLGEPDVDEKLAR